MFACRVATFFIETLVFHSKKRAMTKSGASRQQTHVSLFVAPVHNVVAA
jgi:hypothetical protein